MTAVGSPRHDRRAIVERLMVEQAGKCFYCGQGMTWHSRAKNRVTADHKLPLSRGGADAEHNIVAACAQCNFMKGRLDQDQFCRAIGAIGNGALLALQEQHEEQMGRLKIAIGRWKAIAKQQRARKQEFKRLYRALFKAAGSAA